MKPFMEDDSLLHSLSIFDDDEEEDCGMPMGRRDCSAGNGSLAEPRVSHRKTIIDDDSDVSARFEQALTIESTSGDSSGSPAQGHNDRRLMIARATVTAKEIKSVDDSYFGSYSSFGIHREMLGDKLGELLAYVVNAFLISYSICLLV